MFTPQRALMCPGNSAQLEEISMAKTRREEEFENWVARRVRDVLDGLSLANSGLDELLFEARRPGTTLPAATRDTLEALMTMITALKVRACELSPIPIPEEE
jgi:hypothetical protein